MSALGLSPRSLSLPARACGPLGQGSPALLGCGERGSSRDLALVLRIPGNLSEGLLAAAGAPELWQRDWNSRFTSHLVPGSWAALGSGTL